MEVSLLNMFDSNAISTIAADDITKILRALGGEEADLKIEWKTMTYLQFRAEHGWHRHITP